MSYFLSSSYVPENAHNKLVPALPEPSQYLEDAEEQIWWLCKISACISLGTVNPPIHLPSSALLCATLCLVGREGILTDRMAGMRHAIVWIKSRF